MHGVAMKKIITILMLSLVSSCSSVGLRPIQFIRINIRKKKAIITFRNCSVNIYLMYRPIMCIIVGPPGGIVVSATSSHSKGSGFCPKRHHYIVISNKQ